MRERHGARLALLYVPDGNAPLPVGEGAQNERAPHQHDASTPDGQRYACAELMTEEIS